MILIPLPLVILLHDYNHDIDNYLQLPNNSRMFLISPPASPPVDFDYDQEEEEPNKHQIYTHEEIQEIIKRSIGSYHTKTKYSNNQMKRIFDFEKEIVLNDSNDPNQPKIILNPVNGENDHLIGKAIRSFKTSLPPSSAFAGLTDDELDSDDDEEYQAYKAQLMAQQAD
ncbi:Calcipressin-like protein [Cyberlindnera fabianii]|uniref:Calcipressin-like protein n=1 Tax=Cyberlindnera fabianii TaxID=36022 RepID=A0A1V2L1H0_CYBFA|nr:Calcipressin-like protein [Cyberlindnera fabianii]